MVPKIIHLCWFGDKTYPLEVKVCIASWKRLLPDYQIRVWTYEDARAIGCRFYRPGTFDEKMGFCRRWRTLLRGVSRRGGVHG